MLLPNWGGALREEMAQSEAFGRDCPVLAHAKGFLCPVEETQQCLEKPNREAKRNQGSFKTLWLQKKKVPSRFFSALGVEGAAANCVIALLITYDSLPVRTGPDVLFFDNTGSFRAITLVQFPA